MEKYQGYCIYPTKEEMLATISRGKGKQNNQTNGEVKKVAQSSRRDIIMDLYLRGVRPYEIAQTLKLSLSTVEAIIRNAYKQVKEKLKKLKSDPLEELAYLIMYFDNISRLSLTQYAAYNEGFVKEKFLNTAMRAILCRVKLLVDAGVLSAQEFGGLINDAEIVGNKQLSVETKEKFKLILNKLRGLKNGQENIE
jgi:DNA-binding CsgD family transcriptional regulator